MKSTIHVFSFAIGTILNIGYGPIANMKIEKEIIFTGDREDWTFWKEKVLAAAHASQAKSNKYGKWLVTVDNNLQERSKWKIMIKDTNGNNIEVNESEAVQTEVYFFLI